jgi:pyridoxamine 5'-phosphate oxidase
MSMPSQLLDDPLPAEPLDVASRWLAEAWRDRVQPNPDAMALATCDPSGRPSVRIVLCKEIIATPGYLLFYTNYGSRKGRELAMNPRAAAVLFWDSLHRQVRIEGAVAQATDAESDRYFSSRAWQRQIGAWASRQSEPLPSRGELLESVAAAAKRFHTPDPLRDHTTEAAGVSVPRPPFWGGYRLWADSVELWMEGQYRIHDRARWTRVLTNTDEHTFTPGPWTATRLNP